MNRIQLLGIPCFSEKKDGTYRPQLLVNFDQKERGIFVNLMPSQYIQDNNPSGMTMMDITRRLDAPDFHIKIGDALKDPDTKTVEVCGAFRMSYFQRTTPTIIVFVDSIRTGTPLKKKESISSSENVPPFASEPW